MCPCKYSSLENLKGGGGVANVQKLSGTKSSLNM
jgi:hypothetical protein